MFVKLLEQIQLDPSISNAPAFKTATVEQVTVHAQSRVYEFTLGMDEVLPFAIFHQFKSSLDAAFTQIAKTTVHITVADPKFDVGMIRGYWNFIVENGLTGSAIAAQQCEKMEPELRNHTLILPVENQPMLEYFRDNVTGALENAYHDLGFAGLTIKPEVDTAAEQANLAEFQSKRAEQTAALAEKAASVIQQAAADHKKAVENPAIMLGRPIKDSDEILQMVTINQEERNVTIEGYVFDVEVRELRSKRKLLMVKITDYSGSFLVKKFSNDKNDEAVFDGIKKGMWLRVRGSVQEDSYSRELTVNARDLMQVSHAERQDTAPDGDKRIELHLHTNMSQMDAMNSISDYVGRAAKWGHEAIAVTDHAGLQAYPEAHTAAKKAGMKMLYGVEINLVDDGTPVAYRNDEPLVLADQTYVVFDVETTGLSAVYDKVIELAAVKMKDGAVIDSFEE